MNAMAEEHETPEVAIAEAAKTPIVGLHRCGRCKLPYLPAKSTSALKLTYCSFLCELGDLGFSMVGLETMKRIEKAPEAGPETPAKEIGV